MESMLGIGIRTYASETAESSNTFNTLVIPVRLDRKQQAKPFIYDTHLDILSCKMRNNILN